MSEKLPFEDPASPTDKPLSFSSAEKRANSPGDLAVLEDLKSQRLVRTLPSQSSCSIRLFVSHCSSPMPSLKLRACFRGC